MSIKNKLASKIKHFNAKILHYPGNCSIDPRAKLKHTKCEGANKILKGTELIDCGVGRASFIGRNCSFVKTNIGRYCSIGEDVKLIYGKHPVNRIVSSYPAFYSSEAQYGFTYVKKTIFNEFATLEDGAFLDIGNDVWIGSCVRILGGITIGDGAIIGAGSLVVKDVAPYSVVMGVPAKCKRMRFSEEQINKLLSFRWWEKDETWLKEHANLFSHIDLLINAIDF